MIPIMVRLIVFPVLFGVVFAGTDYPAEQQGNPVEGKDKCTRERVVNLGIYVVYTKSFEESRKRKKTSENIMEYLSLLVNTTALQHFRSISCTNISLVLTGASLLQNSSAVLVRNKAGFLKLDPTLENFQKYSLYHREEFEDPDVTVLFTPPYIVNGSEGCHDSYYKNKSDTPEYKAYCNFLQGGAYYKGICGNNSVGIVEETGGVFQGQTALARVIARLFGVNFDVFSKNESCNEPYTYLLGRGAAYSTFPYLSPCGEAELKDYIDCASNTTLSCWEDNPKPAVAHNYQTPYDFFTVHDFCSRYQDDHYKCPDNQSLPDWWYFGECTEICCRPNRAEVVTDAFTTPYGKSCKKGAGICYVEKCIP